MVNILLCKVDEHRVVHELRHSTYRGTGAGDLTGGWCVSAKPEKFLDFVRDRDFLLVRIS